MKSNVLKCIVFAIITNLIIGCGNQKKADSKKEVSAENIDSTSNTSFEKFKKRHNITSNNLEDFKTKYKDGRKSEIRMLLTYESFEDSLALYPKNKTKILLVVIEWNKSEGIVATENSAFANLNNNQMYGGDVETNRRVAPSANKFLKLCEQFLDSNINAFTKIEEIPNRDINFVSFDFISNKGIFTVQEKLATLENNTSMFSNLFTQGKKLKSETEKIFNRN
jgi:hypothetical protein